MSLRHRVPCVRILYLSEILTCLLYGRDFLKDTKLYLSEKPYHRVDEAIFLKDTRCCISERYNMFLPCWIVATRIFKVGVRDSLNIISLSITHGHESTHGGDPTLNIWISRLDTFPAHSFE